MVRMKGLEPSHLAAPDPKSGVYTNFTTSAYTGVYNKTKKKIDVDYQQKSKSGTPYTIRTYDLRLRRALLYPAELRKHLK